MKRMFFFGLAFILSASGFAQTNAKESVPAERVHNVVESMPRFPGCEEESAGAKREKCAKEQLNKFINEQLKYPADAKYKRTEGTVVVKFVIGSDGEIRDIEVVKSLGDGCDEEALRIIKEMPTWIPAVLNKKHVAVNYKLPIRFEL